MARPVTSELIARTGAALAQGGWRFTAHQLYYATCAAAETPRRSPARGEVAMGVLLGLVALILLPVRPAAVAIGALTVVSFTLAAATRLTRPRAPGRVLAVSFSEFESLLSTGPVPPGLIEAAPQRREAAQAEGRAGDHAAAGVTIVCDTSTSATAVADNLACAGLAPLPVHTLDGSSVAGKTVVALHDASPRGCALPLELVDAGARVIDAGLRPAWVNGDEAQVIQGAPARLPRNLSALLSEEEIDWLHSGRRVELAVLTPERLMRLVAAALEHAVATVTQPEQPLAQTGALAASLLALP